MSETIEKQGAGKAGPCHLCGGVIGPDITDRPMCYGCGPQCMRPDFRGTCNCPTCYPMGDAPATASGHKALAAVSPTYTPEFRKAFPDSGEYEDVADVYERGGYVPTISADAYRRWKESAPVPPPPMTLQQCMDVVVGSGKAPDTSGCCYEVPGGCEQHRRARPSPAAMLGEAARLVERARVILKGLCETDQTPGSVWLARTMAASTVSAIETAQRDAEARVGQGCSCLMGAIDLDCSNHGSPRR